MNVKKFLAATSREALRLVREEIGPDAVILSNRTVPGGVEILALAHGDIASLAAPAVEPALQAAPPAVPPAASYAASAAPFPAIPQSAQTVSRVPMAAAAPRRTDNNPLVNLAAMLDSARNPAPAAPAAARADNSVDSASELHQVMSEIRSMRGMLETQLAGLAWGTMQKREPLKAVVMREMLSAGFSASLARYLTEKLPHGDDAEAGMSWIKSILARNLSTLGNESEILEKGGVYALVGPTGVGKTTTTAKLAARCVMRHGPSKLALITTDGYRIGAYEQLRIYGKILGVMVHSVKDEADLRIALDELKNKHMVLIDTVGVSQRDQMVAQQVAMLTAASTGKGAEVKRLLCLNATSTGETLSEVVRAYKGDGLAGCIITKLDEAATIGNVLDAVIRHKLCLYYLSNGQRVPEDLHVANRQYLVDRAFKLKRGTAPFEFQDSELSMVVANTARAMKDKNLREVSFG
jgi:flagellar biosynthesis protein FlhF